MSSSVSSSIEQSNAKAEANHGKRLGELRPDQARQNSGYEGNQKRILVHVANVSSLRDSNKRTRALFPIHVRDIGTWSETK